MTYSREQFINKKKLLIIGGDSLIGNYLWSILENKSLVFRTSKFNDNSSENIIKFIIGSDNSKKLICINPDVIIICAGITNIKECEINSLNSWNINVKSTVELSNEFLNSGKFVIFLSSNAVFNGNILHPSEYEEYSPVNEYGRQKVATEVLLKENPNSIKKLSIIRLTKVINNNKGFIADIAIELMNKQKIKALVDLNLSPISLNFIGRSIFKIIENNYSGVFHLAGEENLSYYEFAKLIEDKLHGSNILVEPVYSNNLNKNQILPPKYSSLGMINTFYNLGIEPEPLEDSLKNFIVNLI